MKEGLFKFRKSYLLWFSCFSWKVFCNLFWRQLVLRVSACPCRVLRIVKSDCILQLNAAGDFSNRWRWQRMAVSSWTFYIPKSHIYQELILYPFHWLNLGTHFFWLFSFLAMIVFSFFLIYIYCRVNCLHCLESSKPGSSCSWWRKNSCMAFFCVLM